MEAIAKHDFNATAEDELSFRKNQVLKVRQTWVNSYGCIWSITFSCHDHDCIVYIAIKVY